MCEHTEPLIRLLSSTDPFGPVSISLVLHCDKCEVMQTVSNLDDRSGRRLLAEALNHASDPDTTHWAPGTTH